MNHPVVAAEQSAPVSSSRSRYATTLVFFIILLLGGTLRWLDFPQRYEIRDADEIGYLNGGPQLIEGITPGYKAAPAGPQFWAEWAYVAADTAKQLISMGHDKSSVPWRVRPFVALDNALFDTYRDLSRLHQCVVSLNDAIALIGCFAATALGVMYAGWAGGLLIGGLFAAWPMFVVHSGQSRPYAPAWAFGVIGLALAASSRSRLWLAAVSLGLAIGSRIDMLALLPLLWWIYLDRQPRGKRIRRLILASLLSVAVAIFVAPWLITNLAGEIRAIATVRFAPAPMGHVPWSMALLDYVGVQGAAAATLLALVAVCMQPRGRRLRIAILALIWALFFASMLKELGFGMHQHAELFLSLLVLLAASISPLLTRWPRASVISVIITIAVPAAVSAHAVTAARPAYHNELAPWVEAHVPAGTAVYIYGWMMPSLLPTPQSSQALWNEVTDEQAWRRKFQSGLERFGLTADQLPRALSEENLVQERGNRRSWFILGGHVDLPIPRYDIHLIHNSSVFGVNDLSVALKSQDGIVIWRAGNDPPPTEMGAPIMQWADGVSIYCTPELRKTLRL